MLPEHIKQDFLILLKKIPTDRKWWVACSGGGDSVGLVYLITETNPSLLQGLLYFNHGQRTPTEIELDINIVSKISGELNIEMQIGQWDQPVHQASEDQMRSARYSYFQNFISTKKIYLLTGHNLDDQLETFLINLTRGAGLKGLSGISFYKETGIYRPLLNITRTQIREYLKEKEIGYNEDHTNYSTKFKRNSIRAELIPKLKELSTADFYSLIRRTFDLLKQDLEILENYQEQVLNKVATEDSEGYTIDLKKFMKLPTSLHRRVLRLASFKSGVGFLSHLQTQRLLELSYNQAGSELNCGKIYAFRHDNILYIRPARRM
ncbi:MAG: hypothetical protein APR63_08650 [Desulfuromonas sp. SDB]|nr:MAG: hypothetical protein APR63_08650 [Desulfuromonas sp. SDB]